MVLVLEDRQEGGIDIAAGYSIEHRRLLLQICIAVKN